MTFPAFPYGTKSAVHAAEDRLEDDIKPGQANIDTVEKNRFE